MAELYLVEFKGSRKEYFFNSYYHSLAENDWVIIQAERGEDIGRLLRKIDTDVDTGDSHKPRSILRPASEEDLDMRKELTEKEQTCESEVIDMISRHGLAMKVVDVEWQFDGNKMTVFFTADHRVDFRELVKDLASRYRTRIELRQIGVRDEARRIGGFGICGLRQCCNTFIRDFEPVSTQHARDQDLPLNPSKISGNCGRLLCCLRYEADVYLDVKSRFPKVGSRVETKQGVGDIERIDVFNEEAILRGEDRLTFRVSATDITNVIKGEPAESPPDELDDDERNELRRLDNDD